MNAIITGSNRGIGKAMVETFAAAGYNVWACARKATPELESWLDETAKSNGVWIKPVYFEMSDAESVNNGIKQILDENETVPDGVLQQVRYFNMD